MASEFGPALAAEARPRLLLLPALRAMYLTSHRRAAFAAELGVLLQHGAALRAFQHAERLPAVVAELALSGRLAAMGTHCRALLKLSVPYCGGLRLLINVAAHRLVAGLGHIAALAGRAGDAETLLLVPAVGTDPLVA